MTTMQIGVAIAALVKRDHDKLVDLQELLMQACNDYRPDTFDENGKPEPPEELDLNEVLRLGIEAWISGVGMERSLNAKEKS